MSTTLKSIGDLVFGQTRGRLLALLYGAPDESFYVRQIARQIETSAGSVQRELALLTGAGLIERSVLGIQVFYRANREHPAFQNSAPCSRRQQVSFSFSRRPWRP